MRRLPRAVLLLLGAVYVLAGFIGREPWKSADMASFGYMAELVHAHSGANWFDPRLLGLAPQVDALLPYWLGALALSAAPAAIAPELATRIPFLLMLASTLAATWYAVYYLARGRLAQPVAFAFGGEAQPADYARAIADGGLLALLATLGLAQLSHEITPAAAQLSFAALLFYAAAALPYRRAGPVLGAAAGLVGLTLSGAPTVALLLGIGASLLAWHSGPENIGAAVDEEPDTQAKRLGPHAQAVALLLLTLVAAALATTLDLWRWRISPQSLVAHDWGSIGRLLLWFTWPTGLLALWTLWRWRRHLAGAAFGRHLALPLWFALVALASMITTSAADRALLLALPALAALAAFSLPTLKRSMAALIDWFTLLFFSGCALLIWFMWAAMQTGVPPRPAANVARLVPGFVPQFDALLFALALAATLTWGWLVRWRTGRHRTAIWKSLVLPAGGAVLCWLLLTTLWLPVFDYARSYGALVRRIAAIVEQPGCVEVFGLTRAQIAAFRFHGRFDLQPASGFASCPWLIVDADELAQLDSTVDLADWSLLGRFRRPGDNNEDVLLYWRAAPSGPAAQGPVATKPPE